MSVPVAARPWRATMLVVAMAMLSTAVLAQGIPVDTGPPPPKSEAVPPPPTPEHVYRSGEWRRLGGTWIWRAGRWTLPPELGQRWVAGVWIERPWGFVNVPGKWALPPDYDPLAEALAEDPGAIAPIFDAAPPPG